MKNIKNLIVLSLAILVFTLPTISFADISGTWRGKNLSINGKVCNKTSIQISTSNDLFSIVAAMDKYGSSSISCGENTGYEYYMDLIETYNIRGKELFRYNEPMGQISEQVVTAKGKYCEEQHCQYFDYIKITKIKENTLSIWINFNGAILTGQLVK